MLEKLLTIFTSFDVIGNISNHLNMLSDVIDGYLSGIDNLRMASIILMILALLMFLFLIIVIYIKSIIAFLRNEPTDKKSSESNDDDIFDEEDQLRLNQIIEEQERERELEKELQKELDMARAERDAAEQNREKERKRQQEEKQKKAKKEKKKNKDNYTIKAQSKEPVIDLDWKKGQLQNSEVLLSRQQISPDILSYHQSNRSLNELMGLIIDMLGRGVDDLKIAQTIMFRNHYMSSEEDVLQLISTIKDFINLCRKQEFNKLANRDSLPNETTALYHIAEGDATLALAMLEALMDTNIDRAAAVGMENKRDAMYKEVSDQAVVFGNLAAINDIMLATGAFELAIELQPRNVQAWSRLADMYAKSESTSKAIWAYQNVLNIADGEINAREVANASKNLSQHLYAQGNSLQAAKLYNSSKQYYDALGINRRLDKQEIEIIEIIESHHQDEIQSTILKLLGQENGRGFSF